jgi:hypothetical protein
MFIRTQNRKALINTDNATDIRISAKNQVMVNYPMEDAYNWLGAYSTEAKAIKVLDMIQRRYDATPTTHWTFEMPSDEEVILP